MAGQMARLFSMVDQKKHSKRICIGAFAGAHGVRGEVKVKSFTQIPKDIAAYGPVETENGASVYTLKIVRQSKPGLFVARVAEITDRDAAEALKGAKLYVTRDKLPAPEEDEFYFEDLIGLEAIMENGSFVGKVKAVLNHGAGDLLEISNLPDKKGTMLIPFTKNSVPDINLKKRQVVVVTDQFDDDA